MIGRICIFLSPLTNPCLTPFLLFLHLVDSDKKGYRHMTTTQEDIKCDCHGSDIPSCGPYGNKDILLLLDIKYRIVIANCGDMNAFKLDL